MRKHVCHSMCVKVSKQPEVAVPSIHYVGPRDQTQIMKLGSKPFYPLSHLDNPSSDVMLLG